MRPIFKILFITLILLLNIDKIFAQNNSELNYSYEEIEKELMKLIILKKTHGSGLIYIFINQNKIKMKKHYFMHIDLLVIIVQSY